LCWNTCTCPFYVVETRWALFFHACSAVSSETTAVALCKHDTLWRVCHSLCLHVTWSECDTLTLLQCWASVWAPQQHYWVIAQPHNNTVESYRSLALLRRTLVPCKFVCRKTNICCRFTNTVSEHYSKSRVLCPSSILVVLSSGNFE
jgi:hypothetical protein